MNEAVTMVVEDAEVITTPIDTTLTVSGNAADAKAVGDALALKADISQITSVSVNGQDPDAQGAILIDGGDIPVSGEDSTKLDVAIAALDGKTGANIALNGDESAPTIAEKVAEIETMLETFEPDTSGFVAGTNITMVITKAIRVGNLILMMLAGYLGDGASVGTGATICTIPVEYIPNESVYAIAGTYDRNGSIVTYRFGNFYINSSGQLKQNATNSWSSGSFGMTFLYPAPVAE